MTLDDVVRRLRRESATQEEGAYSPEVAAAKAVAYSDAALWLEQDTDFRMRQRVERFYNQIGATIEPTIRTLRVVELVAEILEGRP